MRYLSELFIFPTLRQPEVYSLKKRKNNKVDLNDRLDQTRKTLFKYKKEPAGLGQKDNQTETLLWTDILYRCPRSFYKA